MTSQKLNEEHEILRRFMAVVVSSAFKNSLRNMAGSCETSRTTSEPPGSYEISWLDVYSLSLEHETSTGTLANLSREFANFKRELANF